MKFISYRHGRGHAHHSAPPRGITIIRGPNITDAEATEMLETLFNCTQLN